MAIVRLTSCWNSFEAEVVKGALETAGIPCLIQGSTFADVRIGGLGIANSACEIPILVNEQDLDDALKVIAKESEADTEADK